VVTGQSVSCIAISDDAQHPLGKRGEKKKRQRPEGLLEVRSELRELITALLSKKKRYMAAFFASLSVLEVTRFLLSFFLIIY